MSDTDFSEQLAKLFLDMDDADEGIAIKAMSAAQAILRENNLLFSSFVEQIEERKLLMPTKLSVVIRMMDSTTAEEPVSALRIARNLLKNYGLSFARIIDALDHQGSASEDVSEMQAALSAYQRVNTDLAVQNASMAKENVDLREENKRLAEFELANQELMQRLKSWEASNSSSHQPFAQGILRIGLTIAFGRVQHVRYLSGTETLIAEKLISEQGKPYLARELLIEKLLPDNEAIVSHEGINAKLDYYNYHDPRHFDPVVSNSVKTLRLAPSKTIAAEFEAGKIYLKAFVDQTSLFGRRKNQKCTMLAAMDKTRFDYLFAPV